MKLPAHPKGGVQVGISDILQWRDCAARMAFGMRRHDQGDPPESWSPANAYGSAIHLCLSMLDDGATPDEAGAAAIAQFKQWLDPSDLTRLHEDMERYLAREMTGVRTLLNEGEISIPLFVHPVVGQVWLRARIDRLYQSRENPAWLFHIDYKSGKWAKSHEEVAEDPQIWSYNLTIFEWFVAEFPEIDRAQIRLLQTYDQLNYGEIPTQKSEEQRQEMRRWLTDVVTAMIDDEAGEPTFNQWCPWCPLKMDCPVVQYQLTDWATARIAALMPREQLLNKDGSVSKRVGKVQLDPGRIREYVELLGDVKRAGQVLKSFQTTVQETLEQMPDSEVHKLGKKKSERSRRAFSTEAKRQIVDTIGLSRALMIFELSLAGVERFFGAKSTEAKEIAALAEKQRSYTVIEDL